MSNTNTLQVNEENYLLQLFHNPNIHASYFQITSKGVLSLKPEFRGDPKISIKLATSGEENKPFPYPDALSDRTEFSQDGDVLSVERVDDEKIFKYFYGVNVGSRNADLPECLVIPQMVGEVAVDSIAPGAFYENMAIKAVIFPSTVKKIPAACFYECANLEKIYNVEYVTTVGPSAFYGTDIRSIDLPNLTTLGKEAFMCCSYLAYANIGKVTEIPADCFYKCYALSRVESNCLVKTVGHTALHNTPNLVNADFVQHLTDIGPGAFIKSGLDFDWSSLENCTFGTNATPLQINPTDIWSECKFTPCRNPMPTLLSQKDPRWANRHIGNTDITYSSGCFLFCMMHIYCGFNNLQLSAVEEFESIVESIKPGHLNEFGKDMTYVNEFLQPLGLIATIYSSYNHVQNNKSNLQRLYDALKEGKYAIIDTSSGATNGSMHGHAVVAYGLTEDGKILFADSSNRYHNHKEKGGATYALPYKAVAASSLPGNDAMFCIVERSPIETTGGEDENSNAA